MKGPEEIWLYKTRKGTICKQWSIGMIHGNGEDIRYIRADKVKSNRQKTYREHMSDIKKINEKFGETQKELRQEMAKRFEAEQKIQTLEKQNQDLVLDNGQLVETIEWLEKQRLQLMQLNIERKQKIERLEKENQELKEMLEAVRGWIDHSGLCYEVDELLKEHGGLITKEMIEKSLGL